MHPGSLAGERGAERAEPGPPVARSHAGLRVVVLRAVGAREAGWRVGDGVPGGRRGAAAEPDHHGARATAGGKMVRQPLCLACLVKSAVGEISTVLKGRDDKN